MIRVRFLRTTPSLAADAPFQPGQIITLPAVTREAKAWVRDGAAEILKDEAPETAVRREPEERAVLPPAGRGRR